MEAVNRKGDSREGKPSRHKFLSPGVRPRASPPLLVLYPGRRSAHPSAAAVRPGDGPLLRRAAPDVNKSAVL